MKHISIFIITVLAILTSCKEEIPVPKFKQEKQLVAVDAMITTERKAHYVKLSGTVDYGSQQDAVPLSGAVVRISTDSASYTLTETTPGLYLTADTVRGKVWKTYKLHIELNGEVYEASSMLYPRLLLDSVYFYRPVSRMGGMGGGNEKDDNQRNIFGSQKSTANSQVFFFMKDMVNGVMMNDSASAWTYTSEEFSAGTIDRFGRLGREKLHYGDTVTVFAYSAPKEFLQYFSAVLNNLQPPTPFFGGPPANPASNISNDGLGYFIASDVTKITTIYNKSTDLDSLPDLKKQLGL